MATLPEALNLATQALAAGDRARAQQIYQQILRAIPEEPAALNGLGTMAFQDGVLDISADFFRRVAMSAPRDATFPANLHLVYRRQGRSDQAIECCRQAIALDAVSAELHNNLGVVLGERGAHREAVASSAAP